MSLETVELLRVDRKNQLEQSPASETFLIDGGPSEFGGIFSRAPRQLSKDAGNFKPNTLKPMIMVDLRPSGLVENTTKIMRENGTEYTFHFFDIDDEGIAIIWLF